MNSMYNYNTNQNSFKNEDSGKSNTRGVSSVQYWTTNMIQPHTTLALVTQARRTISYRPCAVTQAQYFESDKVVTQVQLVMGERTK